MIIWGSYTMKKTLRSGQFYCPACRTERPYKLLRPKRWGHLYWIPLIPMQEYPTYAECGVCKGAFVEEAIDFDPVRQGREQMATLANLMVQACLIGAAAADTVPDRPALNERVRALLGLDVLPEPAASAPSVGREAALDLVRAGQDGLTPTGKEALMRMAAGDPPFSGPARDWLRELGSALALTPAHVNGLLAELDPAGFAPPPPPPGSGAPATGLPV